MFLDVKVHNQKIGCLCDGPSWPEACRRNFIKLNYNKMHLVGFICNNSITTCGIKTVKNLQMLLSFFYIRDGIYEYLFLTGWKIICK